MANENIDLHLKKIIESIELLESEKNEIAEQISEVYKEAKSGGFDAKIIRKIVAMRKKDAEELQEEKYLLETYKKAIGMKL